MRQGLVWAVVFLSTATARAAMGPIPGEERFKTMAPQQQSIGAQFGATGIAEDFFLTVNLKTELNLNTSQQAMWDNAVAAGKAARDNARSEQQKIRATLDAELAKAEPDLAAVAAASDGARNAGAAAHRQVRDAWLALYGTFTPDQKTVVKNALKDKLARADAFREKMRERHGS